MGVPVMNWGADRRSKAFFARNGALLAKRVSYWGVGAPPIRILSEFEVRAATDNYRHRIHPRLPTVKGRLPEGPAIAVSGDFNSTMRDHGWVGWTVEQIAILSGITHPHVVRLLGCCLETDIPILVHEFVPGGTLQERIHLRGPLRWPDRVRIATEVADALNYLHTFSALPILHKSIRTRMILLDERGSAKVSGFRFWIRSSKPDGEVIPEEGAIGHGAVDPEYFVNGILSPKSDVYSFGLLLLVLLVGKEPSFAQHEYAVLYGSPKPEYEEYGSPQGQGRFDPDASYIHRSLLMAVLEPNTLQEGKEEDILMFADIALSCLDRKGEDRPAMKDVVSRLWQINCTGD